jgi:hypothetical protein
VSLPSSEPAPLALLHSPLTSAAGWGELPDELRLRGHDVLVVEVDDDSEPPYAARYVARAALQIAAVSRPLWLVGHSGAGPLLPQVGAARRAARAGVAGYLFCDAGLPRAGASRLELLRAEDQALAEQLEAHLREGGRFPEWTVADLAGEVPDPAGLVTALRPRGLDFFTEPLSAPEDWPDAPCVYLRTSEAYDAVARVAQARGWAVHHRTGGHFAALADPSGLADELVRAVSAP